MPVTLDCSSSSRICLGNCATCRLLKRVLRALLPAERLKSHRHSLRIALQFFIAEGSFQGLKGDADEKGIMAGRQSLSAAKNFAWHKACELGDVQIVQCLGDRLPAYRVGEDKGEVAFHRLETRELSRYRLPQRQAVKPVKIDFPNVNSLSEFALLRLCRIELTEPGNGHAR